MLLSKLYFFFFNEVITLKKVSMLLNVLSKQNNGAFLRKIFLDNPIFRDIYINDLYIVVYILICSLSWRFASYFSVVSRIFNDSQRFSPLMELNISIPILISFSPPLISPRFFEALLPSWPLPIHVFRLEQPSESFREIVSHKHVSQIPGTVSMNFQ